MLRRTARPGARATRAPESGPQGRRALSGHTRSSTTSPHQSSGGLPDQRQQAREGHAKRLLSISRLHTRAVRTSGHTQVPTQAFGIHNLGAGTWHVKEYDASTLRARRAWGARRPGRFCARSRSVGRRGANWRERAVPSPMHARTQTQTADGGPARRPSLCLSAARRGESMHARLPGPRKELAPRNRFPCTHLGGLRTTAGSH